MKNKYKLIISVVVLTSLCTNNIFAALETTKDRYIGEYECDLTLYEYAVNCVTSNEYRIKAIQYQRKITGDAYYEINGIKQPSYSTVNPIEFSDDGKNYAYVAERNGYILYNIDGRETPQYDSKGGNLTLGGIVFSPDGKSSGYKILDYTWSQSSGGDGVGGVYHESYVVDGRTGKYYPRVGDLKFAETSQYYSYKGILDNDKEVFVVYGNESKEYKQVKNFFFSSDGKFYSFIGVDNKDLQTMVINGSEEDKYYEVFDFNYNEEKNSYSYIGLIGGAKYVKVENGIVKDKYDTREEAQESIKNDIKETEENTQNSGDTQETSTNTSYVGEVNIISKTEARKNSQVSKNKMDMTKSGKASREQIDFITKNFSSKELVDFYNKFQKINLDLPSLKNFKDFFTYFKDAITYEVHLRDNIKKNITQ